MEKVNEKLMEHDYAIKEIAKAMQDISKNQKDGNEQLGNIAKSISKQEVILEKLANLEANSKESINRIYQRIDKTDASFQEYKDRGEGKGCTALQVLQEKENATDTELRDNVKSNQYRLDKLESVVVWVTRTVIGALLMGAVSTLFLFIKR